MNPQCEEDLLDLEANSHASDNSEGAMRTEDLIQPGPSGEDRAEWQEEREASSPSLYSSFSSSSYHSCVSLLSDSEDVPLSFNSFNVETMTAENIAWEPDAKLETIPKRSRMYGVKAWEGSIPDSSPQNISSMGLLIGKEATPEGNSKEIEEEKAGTSRDTQKRPEIQSPDLSSPPEGAYCSLACFQTFSTDGALEAHRHYKVKDSVSIFHDPLHERRITLQNREQSEDLRRLYQGVQPEQEEQDQSQTAHQGEERDEDSFLKSQHTGSLPCGPFK